MKKKLIISLTIVMCLMCIVTLSFGVYALNSTSFNLNSSLNYNTNDCNVKIETDISGSTKGNFKTIYSTGAKDNDIFEIGKIGFDKSAGDIIEFVIVVSNYSYSPIKVEIKNNSIISSSVTSAILGETSVIGEYIEGTSPTESECRITFQKTSNEVSFSFLIDIEINIQKIGYTPESEFVFNSSLKTITDCVSTLEELVIPRSIGGVAVEKISISKYSGTFAKAKYVSVPYGVRFYSGAPPGPPNAAFLYAESVTLPYSLSTIGTGAFGYSPIETILIPDSITTIGGYIFYSCTKIKTVIFPESITSIAELIFNQCQSIEYVEFPSRVTTLSGVFYMCSNLKEVKLPEKLQAIEYSAFYNSGIENIVIPDSVKSINYSAFQNCSNLKEILLPEGLINIDSSAFQGCTSLKQINLPKTLTTLLESVFKNSGLESISIPSGVTTIPSSAFSFCASLISVNLPNTITNIESSAFSGCGFSGITLPSSLLKIASNAFSGTKLTSITIPANVNTIEMTAFGQCSSLSSFNVNSSNLNYASDANGILYTKNLMILVMFPPNNSITTLVIPSQVTTIANYAFENCKKLVNVQISALVNTIGNFAFYSCDNLAEVLFVRTTAFSSLGTNCFANLKSGSVLYFKNSTVMDQFTSNHYTTSRTTKSLY